jgi:hypothetical protein
MRIQSIKSNSKKFISGVLIVGGFIFTVNANAAESSIESEVTAYVVEQSKQLIEVMTSELKQTITDEINQFSVLATLPWRDEEKALSVSETEINKQISKVKNKEIMKKSAE